MKVRHALRLAVSVSMISPVLAAAPAFAEPSPRHTGGQAAVTGSPRPANSQASRGRQPKVSLVVSTVTPRTLTTNRPVKITGYVKNASGQPLAGTSVRLNYSQRSLISRGQLAGTPAASTLQIADHVQFRTPIPSGSQQRKFTLTLKAGTLKAPVRDLEVFPLVIGLYDTAGQSLAEQHTSIVYLAKNAKKSLPKTSIAWIWPVIDSPHRAGDTPFLDNGLASELAPGGRLGSLAAAPANSPAVPVTWAIDPSLLSDAATMAAKSYQVDKVKEPLPASADAEKWLKSVKDGAKSYFAVPFADPDIASLVHQKMTAQLTGAYSRESVAQDLLGRAPTESIGWPIDGVADQATINRMAKQDDVLLMTSTALQSTVPGLTYTPDATTTVATSSKSKTALAYDSTISDMISAATPATPGSALLAEQRFLAETALMTMERTQPRTLVIAPDRRWNPGSAMATALLNFSQQPWLAPTALDTVITDQPRHRTLAGYPQSAKRQELDASYLKGVKNVRTAATDFGLIFQPPKTDVEADGVLRAASSAWRGARKPRNAFRAILAKQVSDLSTQGVHVVLGDNPSRTLAGRTGTVPITVANDLTTDTVTVTLRVTSRSARLLIKPTEATMTLPPKQKHPVLVQMQANGNGDTDVDVQLLTPGAHKKPFGQVHTIRVHATGLVGTALLITGGALAIVFIGVGVRATRARRRRKQAEDLDDAAAGNPGTGDGTG